MTIDAPTPEQPLARGAPANAGTGGDATEPAAGTRPGFWPFLDASVHLFLLSARRQLWSRPTLVSLVLTALALLIAVAWSMQEEPTVKKLIEEILIPVHAGFLLPIFAVCYGSASIGSEREEGTLVYLLITPLPRWLVYLTKYLGATALVLVWTLGSLGLLCVLARPWGREAAVVVWPATLLGAAAYGSLFHTLGAIFRRGTIVSLAYAFFLEVLLGNMPGIVKRVSLSYYISCMIYDAGAEYRLAPLVTPEMFLAVAGRTAAVVLSVAALGLLAAGLAVFSRREYQDLS